MRNTITASAKNPVTTLTGIIMNPAIDKTTNVPIDIDDDANAPSFIVANAENINMIAAKNIPIYLSIISVMLHVLNNSSTNTLAEFSVTYALTLNIVLFTSGITISKFPLDPVAFTSDMYS